MLCSATFLSAGIQTWCVREPSPPYYQKPNNHRHPIWRLMVEEILKNPHYSVRKLARELEISRTTLYRLRNKNDAIPRISTLSRLLKVYYQVQQDGIKEG